MNTILRVATSVGNKKEERHLNENSQLFNCLLECSFINNGLLNFVILCYFMARLLVLFSRKKHF